MASCAAVETRSTEGMSLPPWRRDASWVSMLAAVEAAPALPRKRGAAPWHQAFEEELERLARDFKPKSQFLMTVSCVVAKEKKEKAQKVTSAEKVDDEAIAKGITDNNLPAEEHSASEPEAELEAVTGSSVSSSSTAGAPRGGVRRSPPPGMMTEGEPDEEAELSASETPEGAEPPCLYSVAELLRWRRAGGKAAAVPSSCLRAAAYEMPVETPPAAGRRSSRSEQQPESRRSLTRELEAESSAGVADEGCATPLRRRSLTQSMKLTPSETSWAKRQRDAVETEDAKVQRCVKSILNKLTLEKFPQLYQQLTQSGVRTKGHVEFLIQEVFEKATTQHHFIDMYADLCSLLHEHFVLHPVADDASFSFKRLLLNQCQASFERYLVPPSNIQTMTDFEERTLAEVRYKTRMLGNIRLVGALLTRKMLASKILFAIVEELLQDPTPESLESAAALLTVVGPTFDVPSFPGRAALTGVFHKIKIIVEAASCEPRARCLLKDVLDLRSSGWEDRKPKKLEGPSTLGEVAEKAAAADGSPVKASSTVSTPSHRYKLHLLQQEQREQREEKERLTRSFSTDSAKAPLPAEPAFARDDFRDEVAKLLRELRHSFDEVGGAARLAASPVPPSKMQAEEFCYLVAEVAQESSEEVRRSGFRLAAGLFDGRWNADACAEGLRSFVEEVCEDLKMDVPALPRIVREELAPIFTQIIAADKLPEALR